MLDLRGRSCTNRMKKEHNVARLWVDCFDYQSNTVIIAELVLCGRSQANRMKIEHIVARLWVDCFDYQSNTVILAELVFRGRPKPVKNFC